MKTGISVIRTCRELRVGDHREEEQDLVFCLPESQLIQFKAEIIPFYTFAISLILIFAKYLLWAQWGEGGMFCMKSGNFNPHETQSVETRASSQMDPLW